MDGWGWGGGWLGSMLSVSLWRLWRRLIDLFYSKGASVTSGDVTGTRHSPRNVCNTRRTGGDIWAVSGSSLLHACQELTGRDGSAGHIPLEEWQLRQNSFFYFIFGRFCQFKESPWNRTRALTFHRERRVFFLVPAALKQQNLSAFISIYCFFKNIRLLMYIFYRKSVYWGKKGIY